MTQYNYTEEKDKIILASTTNDISILKELMRDVSTNVRRAVAKNTNSSKEILQFLAYDPAKNVSVMAASNQNCNVNRSFWEEDHPCLNCKERESQLNCATCKDILNFQYK